MNKGSHTEHVDQDNIRTEGHKGAAQRHIQQPSQTCSSHSDLSRLVTLFRQPFLNERRLCGHAIRSSVREDRESLEHTKR